MTSNSELPNPNKEALRWVCPTCGGSLQDQGSESKRCVKEGHTYGQENGVWKFLPEKRASRYDRFRREYLIVRHREGRGGNDSEYYRSLPYRDSTGKFQHEWRIRAKSFDTFVRKVLRHYPSGSKVLDLGAGNCWLSYRLTTLGYSPVAVDLLSDPLDGLEAHRHYGACFQAVEAEFDRLPFAPGQFDVAVFNASLHYSTSYVRTLAAALRQLREGGRIVIIDSPIYHDPSSGRQMVRERTAYFERHYSVRSDSIPSQGFLTFEQIERLAEELGIEWERLQPFYGLSWALRPLKARLTGHREPARFLVLAGRRKSSS